MPKYLLIVESPTKVRTIKKYLGGDFIITASGGHVKDLPKTKLGVDIANGFTPLYVVISGKNKVLAKIRELSEKVKEVYLAPDPDREGEAIAWHIAEEIKNKNKAIYRVLFREITKKGIQEGLKKLCSLHRERYESQQARRILDRLVGYELSPLLWKKIQKGLSAGRVQSVAVKLVVQREKEISEFVPEEYWTITCQFKTSQGVIFKAKLIKAKGKKIKIQTKDQADKILAELKKEEFFVAKIKTKEQKKPPLPPFITSKMQQEAIRKLKFTPKRTMVLAQRLYEGVELKDEGQIGLITYMRTDSPRVADDMIQEVRAYIKTKYGSEYLPLSANVYSSKKGAQEAHEAIRPTSMRYEPERVKVDLEEPLFRLYQLIWDRFVTSQMNPAIYEQTTVDIKAGTYLFQAQGEKMKSLGWLKIEKQREDRKKLLPQLTQGERLVLCDIKGEQKFTKPPPRFTEASLIHELESNGIGRPSTYAQIISTIQERGYVRKKEGVLYSTDLGEIVTKSLVSYFPEIMDVAFTAKMEQKLDKIEEGELKWQEVLKDFYNDFHPLVENAFKNMPSLKQTQVWESQVCEKCRAKMVIRWSRYGKFAACSRYPLCKTTVNLEKEDQGPLYCPECGKEMIKRYGPYGSFWACSQYPDCKGKLSNVIGECIQKGCKGYLIRKRTQKGKFFFVCTERDKGRCQYISWSKPSQLSEPP